MISICCICKDDSLIPIEDLINNYGWIKDIDGNLYCPECLDCVNKDKIDKPED